MTISQDTFKSFQASILKRVFDHEIARRERTAEGNAMEAMLLQSHIDELYQVQRIIDDHFPTTEPLCQKPQP